MTDTLTPRCRIDLRDATTMHQTVGTGQKMAEGVPSSEVAREEACTLMALFGQAAPPNNGIQMVAFQHNAMAGPKDGRKRRFGRKADEDGGTRRKVLD
jgi:hypothetical protein